VFDVPPGDPAAWVSAVKAQRYRAAYCPVGLTADAATVAAYRQAAREHDIVIAEVGAWSNPLDPDTGKAAAARAKCVAALDMAERIGARCAVNITGSRGPKWDGPHPADLTRETFDQIVEVTRAIVDAVKPARAFYTPETMPWMYPDSTDSYVALLKAIDRRQVAAHFDPVNLVNSPAKCFDTGALIREFVANLGERIVSVHCKDIILRGQLTVHLDECRPGTGGLDYRVLVTELRRLGDAELPLMLEHLPREEYPAAAAFLRQTLQENP
jgi:sugar phosphate isomerase/epimerase